MIDVVPNVGRMGIAPDQPSRTNSLLQSYRQSLKRRIREPHERRFSLPPGTSQLQEVEDTVDATEDVEPTPQELPIMLDERQATQSSSETTVTISSLMSASDVATHLVDHGCENITDRLDMDSCSVYPISSGGFGDVYRGKLNDGTQVAVKTMRLQMNYSENGQKPLKHAARELHTWSKCRHPNVVELLGLVEFRGQIGMVSLWMENGSLPSYLAQRHDVDRCRMSLQISEGLAYLHRSNIVHGDLKGPNVLISSEGVPVLADFGNAILQECTLQFTYTTAKASLSPRWAAPELIKGSGTYSFAADVYALGMTILETITGQVPYFGRNDLAVYFAVAVEREHPKRPEDEIPSNSQHGNILWSILTRCWAYEAETRPRVADVVDIMKTINQEGLTRIPGFKPPVVAADAPSDSTVSGSSPQDETTPDSIPPDARRIGRAVERLRRISHSATAKSQQGLARLARRISPSPTRGTGSRMRSRSETAEENEVESDQEETVKRGRGDKRKSIK